MVSTVRSRPNHYELLGLKPTATAAEITQAYTREMGLFRPHSFSGLADLSIAYETLRDPTKRRAYDASIGLGAESKPPVVRQGWQFVASVHAGPVVRPVIDPLHRPAPRPDPQPQPQPEAPVDQRVAAIVASLRELAKPAADNPSPSPSVPREQTRPTEPLRVVKPEPPAEARADAAVDPVIEQILAVGRAEKESLHKEAQAFEWKQPAVAVIGLIVGVGLLGAWAGLEAGNEVEAERQPQRAVTLAVPAAKAPPAVTASEPEAAPALSFVAARPERRTYVAGTRGRAERAPRTLQAPTPDDRLADVAQSLQSEPEAAVAEQAPPEAPVAEVVAASMPLPNKVIARTIERIGYACGQVTSTAAVEGGAPGVYKVTCASGHSYQASPVRGRYHFRRLSSR